MTIYHSKNSVMSLSATLIQLYRANIISTPRNNTDDESNYCFEINTYGPSNDEHEKFAKGMNEIFPRIASLVNQGHVFYIPDVPDARKALSNFAGMKDDGTIVSWEVISFPTFSQEVYGLVVSNEIRLDAQPNIHPTRMKYTFHFWTKAPSDEEG